MCIFYGSMPTLYKLDSCEGGGVVLRYTEKKLDMIVCNNDLILL